MIFFKPTEYIYFVKWTNLLQKNYLYCACNCKDQILKEEKNSVSHKIGFGPIRKKVKFLDSLSKKNIELKQNNI